MSLTHWLLRASPVLPLAALPLVAAGTAIRRDESAVRDAPFLIAPGPGAAITQNEPGTGCTPNPVMGFGHQVDFKWSPVDGAARYEIVFEREHSTGPVFHAVVDAMRATYTSCHTYVIDINLDRWQWRVRGLDAQSRPGPWSAPGELRFAPCRDKDGAVCGSDPGGSRLMKLVRPGRQRDVPLAVPALVSPPDGARFWHGSPRMTQLSWTQVPGAIAYDVFVDCLHCCASGRWCSEVEGLDFTRHRVESPTYSFDWYGAQPGRWRVRAVSPPEEGPLSPWWTFEYEH